VLGMDGARQEIYIENTLRGGSYWTVSLQDFLILQPYFCR
jgi:hypothetical protein